MEFNLMRRKYVYKLKISHSIARRNFGWIIKYGHCLCHFDINMRHKCSNGLLRFFYQTKRIFGERVENLLVCFCFFFGLADRKTFSRPILDSCSFSLSTWKKRWHFFPIIVQHLKATLYWNNGFRSQIRSSVLLLCSYFAQAFNA